MSLRSQHSVTGIHFHMNLAYIPNHLSLSPYLLPDSDSPPHLPPPKLGLPSQLHRPLRPRSDGILITDRHKNREERLADLAPAAGGRALTGPKHSVGAHLSLLITVGEPAGRRGAQETVYGPAPAVDTAVLAPGGGRFGGGRGREAAVTERVGRVAISRGWQRMRRGGDGH